MSVQRCLTILLLGALVVPAGAADLDKYLPDDTQAIITVNFRQIIEAPVVKKYAIKEVEKGLETKEVQQVISLLGLDPLKDITGATVAFPAEMNEKTLTVIVRGSFDLVRIHDLADKIARDKPDTLTVHKQDNLRLYEGKDERSKRPYFASFMNKEVLVVSAAKERVADAIAKSTGKKDASAGKNLQSLVGQQDGTQSV